jgi:hypothetical protein
LLQHHQHPGLLLNAVLTQFNEGGNGSIVFGLGISRTLDLSQRLWVEAEKNMLLKFFPF